MQEQQQETQQDESRHQELQWEEPRERPDTSKCSRQQNKLNKTLTNFRNTTSRGAGGGILSGTEVVTSDRQQSRSGTRQGRVVVQKQQDYLETKASCFSMSGQGFFAGGGGAQTLEEGVTLDKYFGSGFQVLQLLGDEVENEKHQQYKYSEKQNQILKQGQSKGGQIHETEEEYSESNKQSKVDLGVKNSSNEYEQKQQEELSPPIQELSNKTSITNDKVKRKDFSLTGEHAVIQKKLRQQKQLTKPSSNNSDRGGEQLYRVITTSKVEQINKPSQQQQQLGQQPKQQPQLQPQPQSIRLNRQIVASKQSQYQPQYLENHSNFLDSSTHVRTQAAIPPIHKHNPSALINYQQQISSISDASRNVNDLSFARRKNNTSINQEVIPKQQSEVNEVPWVKPTTPFSASRRKQFQYLKSKPDQSQQSALNVSAFIQPQPASFLGIPQRRDTETEADYPYDEWSAIQQDDNGAIMQDTKGSSFLDACKGSSIMDPGKDSSFIAQSEKLDQTGGFSQAPTGTSKQKQFAIKRVTHNNNSLHENSNGQALIYSSKAPPAHSPYSKEHQPLITHSRKLSRDAQISFHYNNNNNANINLSNQQSYPRGESSSTSQQQQQQQQTSYQQQQTLQFLSRGDCSSLNSCQQTQGIYRKVKQTDVFDPAEIQQAQQRIHRTSFYQNSHVLNTQEQQELSGEELLRHYDNTYNSKISQENSSKSALNTKKIILKNTSKDTTQNTQISEEADISMRRTAKENKFIGQKDKFKQIIKKQDANFLAKYAARFNLNSRECNNL